MFLIVHNHLDFVVKITLEYHGDEQSPYMPVVEKRRKYDPDILVLNKMGK